MAVLWKFQPIGMWLSLKELQMMILAVQRQSGKNMSFIASLVSFFNWNNNCHKLSLTLDFCIPGNLTEKPCQMSPYHYRSGYIMITKTNLLNLFCGAMSFSRMYFFQILWKLVDYERVESELIELQTGWSTNTSKYELIKQNPRLGLVRLG